MVVHGLSPACYSAMNTEVRLRDRLCFQHVTDKDSTAITQVHRDSMKKEWKLIWLPKVLGTDSGTRFMTIRSIEAIWVE